VSLNPYIEFSESCTTVSVNAQGCAMQCQKSIPVGTPVTVRLQNGHEAGGQVAFCKASSSNDKLWGLGVVLDKPGNFWGLNPCPKDWLTFEQDVTVSRHDKQPESRPASGMASADAETMRAELMAQMRKEMSAILAEAANVRESQTAAMQSFQESLDQKVADETKNAIEQIKVCMNTLKLQAQSDTEQLVQRVRAEADEVDTRVQQAFSAELEKAQKKLESDFQDKQESITSTRDAITAEAATLQKELGSADDRITKLNELASQLSNFSTRLDQSLSETMKQARTSLEQLLVEIRNEQTSLARSDMENMLTPISARADSLKKELTDSINLLTRERDEIQTQIASLTQTKEGMQLWLAQQTPDIQKNVENVLSDATVQAQKIAQQALQAVQDPLEKFSSEAKNKIEEFAKLQHSQLGDGVQRLRDVLITLQQQAEDSLRAPFQMTREVPLQKDIAPLDKVEPAVEEHVEKRVEKNVETSVVKNVEKADVRSQTTFGQKLSGFVRGGGSKQR
jgi:hypothetical protein